MRPAAAMPTVDRTPVMDDLGARRGRARGAAAHGAKSEGPSGRSGRIGSDRSGSVRLGSVRSGSVRSGLRPVRLGAARIDWDEMAEAGMGWLQLGFGSLRTPLQR